MWTADAEDPADADFFSRNSVPTMTSEGICSTIIQLLAACETGKVSHVHSLGVHLYPMLDRIMSPNGLDYIEHGVEILGYLLTDANFEAQYWKYFEAMYQGICGGSSPFPLAADCEGYSLDSGYLYVTALDCFVTDGREVFLTGHSTALNMPYRQAYMEIAAECIKASVHQSEGALWGITLYWLLVDSFVDDLNRISDLVQQACSHLKQLLSDPPIKISRSMKEQMCKFYATLLYGSPIPTMAYLTTDLLLDNVFNLILQGSHVTTVGTSKIIMLALTRLLSEGGSIEFIRARSTDLMKRLAAEAQRHVGLRLADESDAGSDFSSDSEQCLDEDDDAKPRIYSQGLAEKMIFGENGADEQSSSEDFAFDELSLDVGIRHSPLNALDPIGTVQEFMKQSHSAIASVLGQEECKSLAGLLSTEIQRTAHIQ